ncbi:MAG: RNA methyltransferase [Eubacteriales bacterium]|nr:RNA methyltransferase [Eubacteriales bacterium]
MPFFFMDIIRSRQNPRIKALRKERRLKKSSQRIFLEGPRQVDVAVSSSIIGPESRAVLYVEEGLLDSDFVQKILAALVAVAAEVIIISEEVSELIASTSSPQGLYLELQRPSSPKLSLSSLLRPGRFYLGLDRIQDPGNLGTILRSAKAFGVDAVFLSEQSCSCFDEKVLRASIAAVLNLNLYENTDLECLVKQMRLEDQDCDSLRNNPNFVESPALKQDSLIPATVFALDLVGSNLRTFNRDLINQQANLLLIGSEGQGLTPKLKQLAERSLRIEMPGGFESLNVAVATSIALFALRG